MKNTITKLSVVLCLILVSALTFTACREKSIYAENSDFESYPEYWNSFNSNAHDTNGEIYLPETDGVTTDNNSVSAEDKANSNVSAEDKTNSSALTANNETSSDDPMVNFTDDEDDITDSSDSSGSDNSSSEDKDNSSSDSSSSGTLSNQGPIYIIN